LGCDGGCRAVARRLRGLDGKQGRAPALTAIDALLRSPREAAARRGAMTFFAELPLPIRVYLAFVFTVELIAAVAWLIMPRLSEALARARRSELAVVRLRERRWGADTPRQCRADGRRANQRRGGMPHRRCSQKSG
jgi:hypothetical protein